jgi:hypothetical protein
MSRSAAALGQDLAELMNIPDNVQDRVGRAVGHNQTLAVPIEPVARETMIFQILG